MQEFLILAALFLLAASVTIDIPACPKVAKINNFLLWNGFARAKQDTAVAICHSAQYLQVQYTCQDTNIVSRFTQCNEPLYEEDAVEIFVAHGTASDILQHYLELEISPKGVLFASRITNPNDACAGISGALLNCSETGIKYDANMFHNGWNATLQIPKPLIRADDGAVVNLRANFFRIDKPLGAAGNEYSAWSPTYTATPCFHVPRYFGSLKLQ